MDLEGNKTRNQAVLLRDGTFLKLEKKGFPTGYIVYHHRTEANSFIYMEFDGKQTLSEFKKNPDLLYNDNGYLDKLIEACFDTISEAFESGLVQSSCKLFDGNQNIRYGLKEFRTYTKMKKSVSDNKVIEAIKVFEKSLRKKNLDKKQVKEIIKVLEDTLGISFMEAANDSYYTIMRAAVYYEQAEIMDEKILRAEMALKIPSQLEYVTKMNKKLMDSLKKKTNYDFSRDHLRWEVIHTLYPDLDFKYSVAYDVLNAVAFDKKNKIRKIHWDSTHHFVYPLDGMDAKEIKKLLFYHERYDRLIDLSYPSYEAHKPSNRGRPPIKKVKEAASKEKSTSKVAKTKVEEKKTTKKAADKVVKAKKTPSKVTKTKVEEKKTTKKAVDKTVKTKKASASATKTSVKAKKVTTKEAKAKPKTKKK